MINSTFQKKNSNSSRIKNERGFVLVASLSCLVVLSLIGIAAMNSSNTEKQIAQNINLAEKSFYSADGATEVGIEMIEWNLGCPLGFTGSTVAGFNDPNRIPHQHRGIEIYDSAFAYDEDATGVPWNNAELTDPSGLPYDQEIAFRRARLPSDFARSMRIPENFIPNPTGGLNDPRDAAPHTNLAIFGATTWGEGGSIEMAAGYEGKGKGAAGSGAVIDYEVWTQKIGINNAEAIIRLGWQHLIGTEGECKPF